MAGKQDKIRAIVEKAAPLCGFDLPLPPSLQCINYLGEERGEVLDFSQSTADCGLEAVQDLLLVLAGAEPAPGTDSAVKFQVLERSRGLVNVSNSCYVNSSVQALVHSSALRSYLSPSAQHQSGTPSHNQSAPFQGDINFENAMGHNGAVVSALSEVFHSLYSVEVGKEPGALIPRSLLKVIGKLSSRFASMEQQDAQELLSALLDGVHEDVNRIRGKKPYHPEPVESDSDDVTIQSQKAREAWHRHLERDSSFIVDNFHGQLQSEVCCSACGKKNIRWEPFSSLVLPLPLDTNRTLKVLLVGFPRLSGPFSTEIVIDRRAIVSDLIRSAQASAELTSEEVARADFVLADIYSNRIHKMFSDGDKIASISSSDQIAVYFIRKIAPEALSVPYLRTVFLPVIQRAVRPSWSPERSIHELQGKPCGLPLVIRFPVGTRQVDRAVLQGAVASSLTSVLSQGASAKPFALSVVDRQGRTVSPILDTLSIDCGDSFPALALPSPSVVHLNLKQKNQLESLSVDWDLSIKDHSALQQPATMRKAEAPSAVAATAVPSGLSLEKCISMFTKVEQLDTNNAWNCSGCKTQRAASKTYSISKLPNVLVVSFKRFSADPWASEDTSVLHALLRSKLTNLVNFPISELNLSQFLAPSAKSDPAAVSRSYELVSVINHFGSAIGGHYTAFCKEADGSWFLFDDTRVSKIEESSLVTPAAYVLVYSCKSQEK